MQPPAPTPPQPAPPIPPDLLAICVAITVRVTKERAQKQAA